MGFYTDDKGRVRPVAGGGGRRGSVLLAGLVALSAVGYGGAVGLSTGGSGGGSPGASVEVRKTESGDLARRGDAEGAWQRLGLHGLKQTGKQRTECVAASFGGVREFLRRTACTSMDRVLFTVGDDAGNSAVISVAWVGFSSRCDAREFQDVVNASGTGDVEPLDAAAIGLAGLAFSGDNHGSDRDRATVTVAEAEIAAGHVTPEVLDALAEVAARLPPSTGER